MDDDLQKILEYVRQNNMILRENNAILHENNLLLRYIKQEIDKEFSLENLIKVESAIFLSNIVANIISNIIYHKHFKDD